MKFRSALLQLLIVFVAVASTYAAELDSAGTGGLGQLHPDRQMAHARSFGRQVTVPMGRRGDRN
jgi:hypothetical protein